MENRENMLVCAMEDLISIATANGGILRTEEIQNVFSDFELSEKQKRYLYDYLENYGITVSHNKSSSDCSEDVDILELYSSEVDQYQVLDYEKTEELIQRAQAGDIEARNLLIESNQRLVISIANKESFSDCGIPFLDRIQEGNIGLINAISNFDIKKGNRFSSYASACISNAIKAAANAYGKPIKITASMVNKNKKITEIITQYKKERGYVPSVDEISTLTGYKKEDIIAVSNAFEKGISLNQQIDREDSESNQLVDMLADDYDNTPEHYLLKQEENIQLDITLHKLREAVLTLAPYEQVVINMSFGLTDGKNMDVDQIALKLSTEDFQIPRKIIRDIRGEAFVKIRQKIM